MDRGGKCNSARKLGSIVEIDNSVQFTFKSFTTYSNQAPSCAAVAITIFNTNTKATVDIEVVNANLGYEVGENKHFGVST